MTESVLTNVRKQKRESSSPAEDLHHISELLEELILLIKHSTAHNMERQSERPSSSSNEVLTVKEAAALLRISLPMMYEFARSGKVHTLEVGRRILISRSSLMALLQEGENNGDKTC